MRRGVNWGHSRTGLVARGGRARLGKGMVHLTVEPASGGSLVAEGSLVFIWRAPLET